MFTLNHFLWLGLCLTLIALSTVFSVKYRLSSQKASVIFLIICFLSEVTKNMANMVPSDFGGYVLDQSDIPLHLCSLIVFAMPVIVFTKNQNTRETLVSAVTVIGTVAPLLAMMLPAVGVRFDRVIPYQYFLYHAGLMWYALHNMITGQAELGVRAYKRNMGYLTALVFLLLYVNSALAVYGANYFYLRKPPLDGLPILNLDHGWHLYFVILLLIGYGSMTLVQLPFMLKEKKNARKSGT